jgi:hypothetical protein
VIDMAGGGRRKTVAVRLDADHCMFNLKYHQASGSLGEAAPDAQALCNANVDLITFLQDANTVGSASNRGDYGCDATNSVRGGQRSISCGAAIEALVDKVNENRMLIRKAYVGNEYCDNLSVRGIICNIRK